MSAIVADSYDLRRWSLSAAVVISLHAALVVMLTTWHERMPGDEGAEAIVVDLSSVTAPPTDSRNDLAPGPEQQQSKSTKDVRQTEQTPRERIEPPPPVPDAEVKLPEEIKQPETPKEDATPPVPETTSPPRPKPSAAQVASWYRKIAKQVEQHKGYPASARARHETGTAELAFTLDRSGKVVTSRIVRTSGSAALDQETMDTVRRAQPFPSPPANIAGETFEFTVPIRFNIR
jgi:periplasmic protein TonB